MILTGVTIYHVAGLGEESFVGASAFSPELAADISRKQGFLTAAEVTDALKKGMTVHTFDKRYVPVLEEV